MECAKGSLVNGVSERRPVRGEFLPQERQGRLRRLVERRQRTVRDPYRVITVGAGLDGLALAHGLRSRGIVVAVSTFIRAPVRRDTAASSTNPA
jgi:NADPH-dependent 2,4-dienoyl-CoA reductase/sulfur reductase-like enzyme